MRTTRFSPLRRVVVERSLLGLLFASCASMFLGLWLSPLLVPLVVAVWLCSVIRHARLIVEVDEQGIRVRNPWRSYVVKWSEVATISPILTESKTPYLVPGLRRSGDLTAIRLWALAVPAERLFLKANEGEGREHLAAVVSQWHRDYGVRIKDFG